MKFSFVIPVYNEQDSIQILHGNITDVLREHYPGEEYETYFIDDGSTDDSVSVIKQIIAEDENVHLIAFRGNCGKSAALQAGFRAVGGEIVFTMDADLQDDPEEIPKFVDKLEEGYDLVSGWKYERHDPLEKRIPSKLFNKYTSKVSGISLHDFNCGFKAYRKEVVKAIDIYGELHRFVPVLAKRHGFRIGEIIINHKKREFGKSKYGIERYLRGMFDSISVVFLLKYRDKPMYFFGRIGLVSFLIGLAICIYLLVEWLSGIPIGTRPLLNLGVLLIILGALFVSIGLIGDLIVDKSYRKNYTEYHIKEKK